MHVARLSAVLALLILGLTTITAPASAADDPYTVTDINVDLTRETSAIARQEAFEQAHVQAFEHLLTRLTPAADRNRLPKVDYALAADHAAGLKVDNERSSATRYAATLTISFIPDRVREFLRDNGADYSETPAPAVVVAPVYTWAGALSLWEETNAWRAAWMQRGPSDGLAPVKLPLGDLADVGALSAAQAAARDPARLRAFAARYGAAGVLVSEANFMIDPVSGRPKLETVSRVVGGGPDIGAFRHVETGAPGEGPGALGLKAARSIVAAMEAAWKRSSAGPGGPGQNTLVAELAISGLEDYAAARRRLNASPGVTRHELVALSQGYARFRLYYSGTPETVRAGVARQSMDLARAEPGAAADWVLIAPPTGAAR